MNNIVRSICYFSENPGKETVTKVNELEEILKENGYEVQTKRICAPISDSLELRNKINDMSILLCIGTISFEQASTTLSNFFQANGVSFNVDLTQTEINVDHTKILFEIIKNNPKLTFNFTYVFNNAFSSPYFPSASYKEDGFAIGLKPTDLAEECETLEQWFNKMKQSWDKINKLFSDNSELLGIDSSIAPLFEGKSSLVNFIKKLGFTFNQSITTNTYLKITKFITEQNPKPTGLCGLMMPCLEDFELAAEYEQGNFSIERNIFLSLHSGLGIDTYPIGVDEKPERICEILKLLQGLSNKYKKPLSARFISDGKAKIGDKTNFQNQYLKDVTIKGL